MVSQVSNIRSPFLVQLSKTRCHVHRGRRARDGNVRSKSNGRTHLSTLLSPSLGTICTRCNDSTAAASAFSHIWGPAFNRQHPWMEAPQTLTSRISFGQGKRDPVTAQGGDITIPKLEHQKRNGTVSHRLPAIEPALQPQERPGTDSRHRQNTKFVHSFDMCRPSLGNEPTIRRTLDLFWTFIY